MGTEKGTMFTEKRKTGKKGLDRNRPEEGELFSTTRKVLKTNPTPSHTP